MWKREIDGQPLTFHLAGINNQNFLMRDEETGSYWQQISGRAVSGPLAGRQLEHVPSEELAFSLWRAEHPSGQVLKPVAKYAPEYEPKDWEKRIGKARTVVDTAASGIPPREIMLGVVLNGAAKAYPLQRVLAEKLVQDQLGGRTLLLVVAEDGRSIRAFAPKLPSDPDFYRKTDPAGPLLLDSAGSAWDFTGCALSGPSQGACLERVQVLKDYWFDWRIYNPSTLVYRR